MKKEIEGAEEYIGPKFTVPVGALVRENGVREIDRDAADEIIRWSRALHDKGIGITGAGNVSARVRGGFLIKAAAESLGRLNYERLTRVEKFDFKGFKLESAVGLRLPSSETPLHALVYKKFRWVGGVAHGHDPLLLDKRRLVKLGIREVEPAPYGSLVGAMSTANAFSKKTRIVVVSDHGAFSIGESARAAVNEILEAHRSALHILE